MEKRGQTSLEGGKGGGKGPTRGDSKTKGRGGILVAGVEKFNPDERN